MGFVVIQAMRTKLLLLLLSILSLQFPLLAAANSAVVIPNGITLTPMQQQQFTLSGFSQSVTWSVLPTGMGTITSTGLYTAPETTGVAFIYAQPAGGGSPFISMIYVSQGLMALGGSGSGTTGIPSPTPAGGGDPGGSGGTPPTTLFPSPISGPTWGQNPVQPTDPAGPTTGSSGSTTGISISISPASIYLQAGQSGVFSAPVQGTTNQQVQWSLSPNLGTIFNGFYTAPASFGNQMQVTISATSLADPTKTATATVLLGQSLFTPGPTASMVSIAINPATTTFSAGQAVQFTAKVQGTTNTGVIWSLTPNIGTLVNGLYTAPSNINSEETITLIATSTQDPSKSASTALILQPIANPVTPAPTVNLSLSPGSATLSGGQSATFTSTVSGTSNTAVSWSLNPQVGTITNGVYQAPATIASQQTVKVIATSAADSTKTASATVTLQPVAVTVGPPSTSLGASQSATFTASVTGSSNTAVTWSLNPSVGTLVNGVYTAPSTISSGQTVTITATSVADPTKSATATVSLTATSNSSPPPTSNTSTTVTLPVEVIGANGMAVSNAVEIPNGSKLSGQLSLWMQIHGLRSQTQASVQVNNSAWMPINSSTVTLLGNAAAYGGIGGGFGTLSMTMNLPSGAVQTGTNTITFRFNQTDGRVSGFRVLAFNVEAADGTMLIPATTFVEEDPNNWQPPSTNASDISAGQTLWHTAALTTPLTTGGTKPILAHCSDCHTQDGRDLKYFNYSNNSIQARAVFHGLTAQQGDQIASYIRSLNVVNPGRPWNPPYQPGPGLDSQPVSSWAAGAGLAAVLDSDQDMINAIFPSGFQSSAFAATSRLNQRELPLPVQLPDWNQWLPGTHPMDAFGSNFTSSGYNTIYQTLASNLQAMNPAVYVAQKTNFDAWFNAFYGLYVQEGTPIWANPSAMWTPANVDAMYSLAQWGLVKNWELNSQFQLEGFSQNIFGAQADPRAWYSQMPFFVSPHDLQMPTAGVAGLRNGTQADYIYLSYIWYNLQLILNDSNGHQAEQYPIDWPYTAGFVKDLGSLVSPQGGIQTMWMIKGLEILQQLGIGPQLGAGGWQPNVSQISLLVTTEWNENVWTGVDPTTRSAIATGLVQSWLQQASQFTPQQFYAGGWTTQSAVPVAGGSAYDNVFPDWVWYMIPRFAFIGVDPTLVGQLAQWAQTMWPGANWTADQNATCSWGSNPSYPIINCSE